MIDALTAAILADKVPYLVSPPGWGKTSVAKLLSHSLANRFVAGKKIRVAVVFLAQRAGNEIHGIPVVGKIPVRIGDQDLVVVEQAPPDYAVAAAGGDDFWLIVYDELNQLTPSDAGQAMSILTERLVGGVSLDRNRIGLVAAGNPPELSAGGWTLPPPLRRRLVVLPMRISTSEFAAASAFPNNWGQPIPPIVKFGVTLDMDKRRRSRAMFAAWVQKTPGLFDVPKDITAWQDGFACPATLEDASDLLASAEQHLKSHREPAVYADTLSQLLAGAIGPGNAASFLSFLESAEIPEPASVLADLSAFQTSAAFQSFQDRHDLLYLFLLVLVDHLRTLRRKAVEEPSKKANAAAKTAWEASFDLIYLLHAAAAGLPADMLVLTLAAMVRSDIKSDQVSPPKTLLKLRPLIDMARAAGIAGSDVITF